MIQIHVHARPLSFMTLHVLIVKCLINCLIVNIKLIVSAITESNTFIVIGCERRRSKKRTRLEGKGTFFIEIRKTKLRYHSIIRLAMIIDEVQLNLAIPATLGTNKSGWISEVASKFYNVQ